MQNSRKVMITRRRRRRLIEQKPKYFLYIGFFLLGIVALVIAGVVGTFLVGVGSAYAVYDSFAQQLPDPTAIETEQEDFETSKIYDRTGTVLLYELFDPYRGDRSYVTLDEIPEFCRDATVILEDKTFYSNPGFDPEGIGRAFYQNLQGGQVQGGSSITQQLIKNILIDEEERTQLSYTRKIKEVILASEITRRFEKDQILEWYFNTNFYGNLAYGINAAAKVYFDKPISALTPAECAILAPIPQFPYLNPINSADEAKYRQWITLKRMVEEEAITGDEAQEIFAQQVEVKQAEERFDIQAPHFAIHVREELERTYDPDLIYRGGLKIYTTLDFEMNEKAREIMVKHITDLQENGNNASNACVVSINPKTGEILTMVGSVDFWDKENDGNVNVCTADPGRQPGSSFKPFSYLTLFSQGVYNPASMIMNVRQSFPDYPNPPYVPENYDRQYTGPIRARYALQRSLNIPAVWVLHKAGIKNVIATAHRMGITTLNQDYYGLALTLGGGEVKPIDMAYAYSVLANMGAMAGKPVLDVDRRPGHRTLDPVSILRIEDKNGEVIYEYAQPETEQVIDPALAYMMNDILSDNNARAAAFGANSDLKRDFEDRPIAAKTGTTNNFRDNWTVGFTPQLATTVWVGNNDNSEMKDVTGLSGAAPIWHDVMLEYHKDKPVEEWQRPRGIVDARVDSISGLLPTEYTPGSVYEIFLDGTVPTQKDPVHQMFRINRENGKLATVYTPPELVEERVYEVYPPEAADWVRENGIPQPPTEYDDSIGPAVNAGPVAFINPRPYEYVKGGVVITGNATIDGFQLYRVEVGQGLNPVEWKQLGGDYNTPIEGGPLAFWDTTQEEEGLYTLQLTVVRGDQSFERRAIQVTVDNSPPLVELINPEPNTTYEYSPSKLLNDWINFQVDAQDNLSMNRVEYYLDNKKVGESTVSPYTFRYNVSLADTQVAFDRYVTADSIELTPEGYIKNSEGLTLTTVVVAATAAITDPAQMLAQLPPGQRLVVPDPEEIIGYQRIISGGLSFIETSGGITQSHTAHIVAFDSAGNRTESKKVPVRVIPKKEDKDEDEEEEQEADTPPGDDDGAFLNPLLSEPWRRFNPQLTM